MLRNLKSMARSAYRRVWVLPKIHRTYRNLSVQETFQRIYRTGMWGNDQTFSSGDGSRGRVVDAYSEFVIRFIEEHGVRSVVDLGCGDFMVGRAIIEASPVEYRGIDVVPELIEYHRSKVRDARVQFECADIASDPLPAADLCLVRQVLQHLCNEEIAKVLANLRHYPKVLISEHVPIHPRSFNRDKPHGPDIRGYYGSGVWVERSPFAERIAQAWEIPLEPGSLLRTVLLARESSVAPGDQGQLGPDGKEDWPPEKPSALTG